MELEKTKGKLKKFCEYENSIVLTEDILYEYQEAIETVLQALEYKDELIEDLQMQTKGLNGIIQNSIPKKKIEDILQNKFIAIYEGNAEFPDDATEMKLVRYVREDSLQELLEDK